jgi:hypothetical protein
MIIDNLKNRKYTIDGVNKVIDGNSDSKLPQGKSASIVLTILRTPWDTNILTDKDKSDKELSVKYLSLNMYLESYQPKDAPFSVLLSVGSCLCRISAWTWIEV